MENPQLISTQFTDVGQTIVNSINEFIAVIIRYLPNFLAAALVLVAGYIIARLLKSTTHFLVKKLNGMKLGDKTLEAQLDETGITFKVEDVTAAIVYWGVLLTFLMAAANTLGLPFIAETISSIIGYLPQVIAGMVILSITLVAANVISKALTTGLESLGFVQSKLVANIAGILITLFGLTIAIEQLGIDITLLTTNITMILTGVTVFLVITLSWGSRKAISNAIAGHYLKKEVKVGDKVSLGDISGEVLSVGHMMTKIKATNGEVVLLPNDLII